MWILRSTAAGGSHTLRFPPGAVKIVGRGPRADFVVAATLISRVHCQLSASALQLVVEDLKSTNGTFVNEQRIECVALKDGDRLRLGRVEFAVTKEETTR